MFISLLADKMEVCGMINPGMINMFEGGGGTISATMIKKNIIHIHTEHF